MARRSPPGLLVETYHHTPTGAKVEIRYERTKQIHYGVLKDKRIEHKDFDECKKLIITECAKDDNLVWTPFIELSGRSHQVISANRYEGAIRPDGSALLIDWDIKIYKDGAYQLIAAHGGFTDELRNKYARQWYIDPKQSDMILATLTEGKPYRVKSEDRGGYTYSVQKPISNDYAAQLTYIPYAEHIWVDLQRIAEEQKGLNEKIVELFSTETSPVRLRAVHVVLEESYR